MLEIVPVPVLRDNYVWLVHDPASDETVAVDPVGRRAGAGRGRGARLADQPGLEHPLASRPYRRQRRDPGARPAARSPARPRPSGCRRWTASSPAATGRGSAAIEARADRHPRPHRRPRRLPPARRAGRVRRRHPVRDGLRPPVRGRCRGRCTTACSASPRLPPETRDLLRPRIYARQRPASR